MKLRQKIDGRLFAEVEEEETLHPLSAFIIGILTALILVGMCRGG